jgi:hypothetical protein
MIRGLGVLLAVLAANACAEASPSAAAAARSEKLAPNGATIGPSGYATITDAPPPPFTPVEPGQPQPPSPEQIAAQEQFRRSGEFQIKVRGQVQALANRLRAAEQGNFVDLYYENEGEPHVVFRFLRNGKATLAKYTKHPRFIATDTRYSRKQLDAAMEFMLATFRDDRVIIGGGTGTKMNRAEVEIAVTEEEFRALVARKGVTIPEAVHLKFLVQNPASAINRPLPSEIASLVRIFPRYDRPLGPVPDISTTVKPVLVDGCFRLADRDNALVLFPLGARLFIDREGYLAFGEREVPGYARVGESVEFHGTTREETAPELVNPIRAACGPGQVLMINGMKSAAAAGAQNVVDDNAGSVRHFRSNYGLSEAVARKAVERCKAVQRRAACLISPPSPPPPGELTCPPGTKATHGMCRTPEGYLRPLPKWLVELIEE